MYSLPEEHFQGGKPRILRRSKTQGVVTGGPALIDAVNRAKVHLAKFILDAVDKSSNILEYKDFKGKTPLIRTCYIKDASTRIGMLALLLEYGANVNAVCDQGRSLLSYSCELQCNDVIKKLTNGTNVNPDIADECGNTPLMYCAMVGNYVGISLILRPFRRLGLNVDAVNSNGHTAAMLAALHGNLSCLRVLIVEGRATLNVNDPISGRSLVEIACDSLKIAVSDFDVNKLPEQLEVDEPGTPPADSNDVTACAIDAATSTTSMEAEFQLLDAADQLKRHTDQSVSVAIYSHNLVEKSDAECQSDSDSMPYEEMEKIKLKEKEKEMRKLTLMQAQNVKNTAFYRSSALDYFSTNQGETSIHFNEHSVVQQPAVRPVSNSGNLSLTMETNASDNGVLTRKKKVSDCGIMSEKGNCIAENDETLHEKEATEATVKYNSHD